MGEEHKSPDTRHPARPRTCAAVERKVFWELRDLRSASGKRLSGTPLTWYLQAFSSPRPAMRPRPSRILIPTSFALAKLDTNPYEPAGFAFADSTAPGNPPGSFELPSRRVSARQLTHQELAGGIESQAFTRQTRSLHATPTPQE